MNTVASSTTEEISKEEAIYHLVKKERAYYETLLEIGRQENNLLKIPTIVPGWRAITPLLKKKRVLLKCISEIEQALEPLKTYWHTQANRTSLFSKKIHQELKRLNLLLEEILQLDESCHKHMENQLLSLKEQGTRTPP